MYVRAFVLWFDIFFNPRGEMVPPETPAKVHSDEVDVGDVIKLRRRKTVSEKRRGGLRSNSLVAEKKANDAAAEGQPAEAIESGALSASVNEEPIEEREESFSTGPFSKETHWKQVVFLLKEPIELYRGAWPPHWLCVHAAVLRVLAGVTVTGTLHCRKSEGNSRELDIEFQYRINRPENEGEGDSPLIVQSFKVC